MTHVRCYFYVVIFMISVAECLQTGESTQSSNMTELLNRMLDGYDRQIRPGFGGPPLIVKADMLLRTMGPISELEMVYSMDCYFRQTWVDKRLAVADLMEDIPIENMSLSIKVLEGIWVPDSVFFNGKHSYVHTITTPNKFLRIDRNGSILYSQRLTIRANCLMHLEKFPLDTQECMLHFGSFGYTTADVVYQWRYGRHKSVDLANDLSLSQFDLIGHPAFNSTDIIKGEPHAILSVKFYLRRHTGYFLIQMYVPCSLLVVISWVSFWINREATADRVNLGSTTVLTLTLIGIDNKEELPKVSYITALDLYVAICFAFVLASIVQFAAVHYFTKYGTGDALMKLHYSDSEEEEVDLEPVVMTTKRKANGDARISIQYGRAKSPPTSCGRKCLGCFTGTRNYRGLSRRLQLNLMNSVSKIDIVCRILFPLLFLIVNITYWVAYLYYV